MKNFWTFIALLLLAGNVYGQTVDTLFLWPDQVPGEQESKGDPVKTENTSGNVTRLTDITNPAIIVYKPDERDHNGKGIIVCPGGGYKILAIDKEGYEIAEWLNDLGYTAFVLQYRVPDNQAGALQDIQRAIRMIRAHADNWEIGSDPPGLIGFSAGASLSARISTNYMHDTYEPVDNLDTLSARPGYAMLIYPAYLDLGDNRRLTPELQVNESCPPMFIFATADDSYGNSALVMTTALRDAGVPVEMHMLPFGGHGYGLRAGNKAAGSWPRWAENWLKQLLHEQ